MKELNKYSVLRIIIKRLASHFQIVSILLITIQISFSQDLKNKYIKDVVGKFDTCIVYPSPNGSLHRTVFTKTQKNDYITRRCYSNNNGKIIIDIGDQYEFIQTNYYYYDEEEVSVSNFIEGLAAIRNSTSGLIGFIDTTGKMIIEPEYTTIGSFSEGLAYFGIIEGCSGGETKPNKMGYIDKTNTKIIQLPSNISELYGCCFFKGGEFKNGIAIMQTTESGFDCNSYALIVIDKNGKILNYMGDLRDVNGNRIKLD